MKNTTSNFSLQPALNELQAEINRHPALKALEAFGKNLKNKALDPIGLKTYFATMWAFFKEIPVGILTLASRVIDDWMAHNIWEGTAKGAHILFADVDEFGLQISHKKILPTHHQLFKELTQHVGVQVTDLMNDQYILKEGVELGKQTYKFYRKEPISAGLGFHFSSELSSSIEFIYFLEGFTKHKEVYQLQSDNDPVLTFFRVHTAVEPMHLAQSQEVIQSYITRESSFIHEIRRGAHAFMDGFEALFFALNKTLYH
jgi:hypothetical protein